MCVILTIAGLIALAAAGFGLFLWSFIRKLNAADRADEDWQWGERGDMCDPHATRRMTEMRRSTPYQ